MTDIRPDAFAPGDARQLRVSVITPSFNQARFLRQTIESVLAQSYSEIDYLVVDGGSTDGSIDVLRSFGDRVRWISEADRGQSDAIARGFARTRGEILCWINSDDTLAAGAVQKAVAAFRTHPAAGLIYGNGLMLDKAGNVTGPFPWVEPFDLWRLVYFSDYILQPAAFFRRSCYEAVGGVNIGLRFAMDWDLWIRLAGIADVVYLQETLGCSRVWSETKTATGRWRRIAELARLARTHTGRRWTPAVKRYALDTLACDTRRILPRQLYPLAEFFGRRLDHRILRRMPAHADGWLGPRGSLLFPRRWGGARIELEVDRMPSSRGLGLVTRLDRRVVRQDRVERPGRVTLELPVPEDGSGPLCQVEIEATHSFRLKRDTRRVALRLLKLEPLNRATLPAVVPSGTL